MRLSVGNVSFMRFINLTDFAKMQSVEKELGIIAMVESEKLE